jgi:hypothetical protein
VAHVINATWKTVVDPSALPDEKLEEWLAVKPYSEAEKQSIRDDPSIRNAERIQFRYDYEEAQKAKTAYTNYVIENEHILGDDLVGPMRQAAGTMNVVMSRARDQYFEKNVAIDYEKFEEMQGTIRAIIRRVGERLMFIRK